MTLPYAHPTLRREVGLFGAVMLGLGSILGTGVFVALPLKTAEVGLWIIPAIVVAGLVALCNALSSAQLAAAHPVAGGTYEYGYRFLKPWLGFTAGWTFLLAKSASAATAALGIGALAQMLLSPTYNVVNDSGTSMRIEKLDVHLWWVGFGLPIVALIALLATSGIKRSSQMNAVLVTLTISGLLVFSVAGLLAWLAVPARLLPSATELLQPRVDLAPFASTVAWSFVAFTGYGRLATLGEEVREPRYVIPRAIAFTLVISLGLYLAMALALLSTVGHRQLAMLVRLTSDQPGRLVKVTQYFEAMTSLRGVTALVTLAAVTAMLGVLLNLILGLSRVWLAMARRGDAPAILARIHEPTSTPRPAVILTGVVIAALVLVGDVRLTWSFSAFTVLIYYAITNWAALKLPAEHRLYPRWIAWCGLIACASLAWFVEWQVWATGVVIIGVGLAWHAFRRQMNHGGHGGHGEVAAAGTLMGRG